MTAPTNNATFYADFKSLAALKRDATTDSQKALRGAAQQFESLFINEMLKTMREATSSVGDSITGGSEMDLYKSMFDEQIATQMSKGKGLGLADMLVQQLNRSGMVKGAASSATNEAGKTSSNDVDKTVLPDKKADGHIKSSSPSTSQRTLTAPVQKTATQASGKSITAVQKSASPSRFSSPAEFVEKMWPHAQEAAQKLGVDPTTLIAHAALETGWGKHIPCHGNGSSSHNLFGIKAGSDWNGSSVGTTTLEFTDGVAVKKVDRFKAYDSTAQCFADYASLLASHPRYSKTLNTGSNTAKFAAALQKGGYATDPDYAHKLKAVARSVMSLINGMMGSPDSHYARVSQVTRTTADT